MHHWQWSVTWSRCNEVFSGDTPAPCCHRPGCVFIMWAAWWSSPCATGRFSNLAYALLYVSVVFPGERTKELWPQSAACSWHLPASLCGLVIWRRCFLLAIGKRVAGLAKQFNSPREGTGSGLGPNSIVAVEHSIHRDWRFLTPMAVAVCLFRDIFLIL